MAGNFELERLRKRLHTAALPKPSDGTPVAAVAIILDPNERGAAVLLIRRSERAGDPWSGQIAFPGGRKASSDRDFLETAMREAKEEVGIELREHELLGSLPLVETRTRGVQVMPYVFQLKTPVTVHGNQEVAESFWVPFGVLANIRATKTEVDDVEGRLSVEAYIYNGHVIWGLTFRIINLLLDRK